MSLNKGAYNGKIHSNKCTKLGKKYGSKATRKRRQRNRVNETTTLR